MSQMGQTETSACQLGMSGLPPTADIIRLHAQVRSVPQPDMRSGPSAAISSDRLSSGNIKTDYIDPVRTSANWKLSQTANLHRQGGPKLLHRRAGCEHHEAQGLRQRKPALASLHPRGLSV
jgi:hypothetical protein